MRKRIIQRVSKTVVVTVLLAVLINPFQTNANSISSDSVDTNLEESDDPINSDTSVIDEQEVSGNDYNIGEVIIKSIIADSYRTIQISFEPVPNAAGYEIYRGIKADESDMGLYTVLNGNDNTTFSDWGTDQKGLQTCVTYYYKIKAFSYQQNKDAESENIKIYGPFSKTGCATPGLDQVKNVTAVPASYKSIDITWNIVCGSDGYLVYYAENKQSSFILLDRVKGELANHYVHKKLTNGGTLELGKKYYYKIVAYHMLDTKQVLAPESDIVSAAPKLNSPVVTNVSPVDYKTLTVSYEKVSGANGYVIYRSAQKNKGYKKVGTVKKGNILSFQDSKCKTGVTYYYKVKAYRKINGKNKYSGYSETKDGKTILARAKQKKPVILAVDSLKIRWNKVGGADGFVIYRSSEQKKGYKKVLTIKNGEQTSAILNGLTNGQSYYFKIRAYTNINGKRKYSAYSNVSTAVMNLAGYDGESYSQKAQRIFGLDYYQKYATKAVADQNMVSISVPVWDFAADGQTKVTKYRTIIVHKNIALTVKQIFKEIYEGPERFPIKNVSGYTWRGTLSNSEHCCGLALDINWEENYMIENGVRISGKYWKPGEDPYSIPSDGDVVRIMKKYGFTRGIWGSRCDYMHFSYFGG